MNKHKFPYYWKLADGFPAKDIKPSKLTVFGTFVCGGGSTMGYKLAGYNHLGGVEIDEKVANVYLGNHNPHNLSDNALKQIGSFPIDYDFKNIKPQYLIGMSVPPVMIAQIATSIKEQWFDKEVNNER